MRLIIVALFGMLAVGCGNVDEGKVGLRTAKAKTSAVQTASTGGALQLGPCQRLQVQNDPGQVFTSVQACAGVTSMNVVRIKTSAYFSTAERYCVVPLSFAGAYAATCFTVNGQADLTLSTEAFTAIAMVRESDLNAYTSYLTGQTASPPAMGYANLR